MKTIFKITFLLSSFLIVFSSCNREEELKDESVIQGTPDQQTELDKWIKENFTNPYNIRLLYKYDDTKTDQIDYVVPTSYEKSVQMANIIKYLFLDPYKKHTPEGFLEKYGPKYILLIGSGAYNPNGTVKLGLAENGVQFSLYNVNALDVKKVEELYDRHFRTIYHEFSHILHQTVEYSPDFKRISAKDYVGDSWNTEWKERSSLEAGFISDYSTKDANEDFVELIAHYLTYSPERWQKTLNAAAGENGDKPGKRILEQKIAIVIDYMQKTWEINLNDLRDEIQKRASKIDQLDINSLK
ncbi:putative zinc-binding metallopeptidase [Weeksellaceae bacterium TAE3-ERU29]|nr:putative zinc-binding metallopeptidase [Weeksellaceae bacterium TAE3-ERU29]